MVSQNTLNPRISNLIRTSFVLISAVVLLFVMMPNFAQENTVDNTVIISDSSKVSEEQVRKVLAEILIGEQSLSRDQTPDASTIDGAYDQSLIDNWQEDKANILGEKISLLVRKFPDYPKEFSESFKRATNPEIGRTSFQIVIIILFSVILGLIAEQFATRRLLKRLYQYVDKREKTTSLKLRFIVIRIAIQIIGVAVLAIILYSTFIFFRNENPYFQLLFIEIIKATIMLRIWMIMLRNIFSPNRPTLRPINLDNKSASQLFIWFSIFFLIIEFGGGFLEYLTQTGMDDSLLSGLLIPYTLSLNLIILGRIWSLRHKITAMFVADQSVDTPQKFARDFFSTVWPFFFTVWLLILWMMWLYKAFLGQWTEASFISISWWITLAFLVADRIFYGLVKNVINIDWLQGPNYEYRSTRFIQIVLTGFRILLVAIAVYMFSLAWGFKPNSLMESNISSSFLSQSIELLFIGTITYIVWEFFNALIERNLPEELDAITSLESDGGGAGATRAETLLPLMRTLLTVILVLFVVLSVLHSLGIAITPLLAGAGVVGIAIGFGAQKLVQDVLSGIFFLVDDAFRKSEYIEIENLRGTVEKISLRSMQLRHHLGAVQTIPYGEIKTVKNLSRDWVTMKLELRLSYDTDIEQVRKIIKKVGQSMLEDEEMGPSFILPLKSQGVMRVEESALIVRMKFTTKPGEQWVIRREAYRRVRDALSAADIFFAHREVRVRLPDEITNKELPDAPLLDKETLTKAGAAAAESMIAEEAEAARRLGKMDSDDDR